MLTAIEINTYQRDGLLVQADLFSTAEVQKLLAAFERDANIAGDHRIAEGNGTGVRAVYASHQRQQEYASLTRAPRLLGAARQLLGSELYVYQCKINSKAGFGGSGWAWHQDYIAWRLADNIPGPQLINVAVFLDDVNEFNGPVIFVPGSHTSGVVHAERVQPRADAKHVDPDEIALTSAELAPLVSRHGLVSPKGNAGTAVFFHPGIVHGSAANMSPYPRRLLILTYNRVDNQPRPMGEWRPDYLVGRDTRPLELDDRLALEHA
jgi:ectoine hydroxylase